MQHFIQRFFLQCLMLMVAVSCIDDYELPSSDTEPMVVIFGQIVGESDCVFTLRSTIRPTGDMNLYAYINDAKVVVQGTDGQTFVGQPEEGRKGRYVVPVGLLDPKQKYYVKASTMYGDFESEPMQPLDAPDLLELYYEQPRADQVVDFVVSTDDPHQQVYLLWQVDEYWEIYTPSRTVWEYRFDPGEDPYGPTPKGSFVKLTKEEYTDHGWRHGSSLTDFASNQDYGNGAVTQRCICQRSNTDRRFMRRCLVRIRQMAVCQDEYEYRTQLLNQSSEVGGLFAPMPSELPTNIRSHGDKKALGYIGVRGHVSTKEMYINRSDVNYKGEDHTMSVPESKVMTPAWMVNNGYAVYSHDPDTGETEWTLDWCVDYRSSYWGGTEAMQRPEFWKDK